MHPSSGPLSKVLLTPSAMLPTSMISRLWWPTGASLADGGLLLTISSLAGSGGPAGGSFGSCLRGIEYWILPPVSCPSLFLCHQTPSGVGCLLHWRQFLPLRPGRPLTAPRRSLHPRRLSASRTAAEARLQAYANWANASRLPLQLLAQSQLGDSVPAASPVSCFTEFCSWACPRFPV